MRSYRHTAPLMTMDHTGAAIEDGRSASLARKLADSGELECVRTSAGERLVLRSSLERYLARRASKK